MKTLQVLLSFLSGLFVVTMVAVQAWKISVCEATHPGRACHMVAAPKEAP